MEIKGRIWIEDKNRDKVFGIGVCKLLKYVKKTGSLSMAARSMEMSYNKAHNLIKAIERRTGDKLLERKIGGQSGGGSTLTDLGEELVKKYTEISEKIQNYMDELSEEYFN